MRFAINFPPDCFDLELVCQQIKNPVIRRRIAGWVLLPEFSGSHTAASRSRIVTMDIVTTLRILVRLQMDIEFPEIEEYLRYF
jgi:hypothetical protein